MMVQAGEEGAGSERLSFAGRCLKRQVLSGLFDRRIVRQIRRFRELPASLETAPSVTHLTRN